jgi:hypothetical protein
MQANKVHGDAYGGFIEPLQGKKMDGDAFS